MAARKFFKTKEWLEEQYLVLRKSTCKIAREQRCDQTNIQFWLRKYVIPIRSVLEANKGRAIFRQSESWLKHQYLELKKSACKIAKEQKCSSVTVGNWLKKYGIPRRTLKETNVGHTAWNKDLTKETDVRIMQYSEAAKGRHPSPETLEKMRGHRAWSVGLTKETDERLRRTSEALKGEKGGGWIDGRSYLPYPVEFDRQLKELVRNRDNYQCQRCGCSEIENMQKLSVHHIDYVKKNCLPMNLISLCRGCNALVNSNREFWSQYFSMKLKKS